MSRRRKAIQRLARSPRDVTWRELVTVLESLGYREHRGGTTGGSRRRFVHPTAAMILLHEPHPSGTLKAYQVRLVVETLRQEGLI